MATYRCWLFDKDKHTVTLRTLECATEEVKESAWMLLRREDPVIHAAEVWDEKKRLCRVERGLGHTQSAWRRAWLAHRHPVVHE